MPSKNTEAMEQLFRPRNFFIELEPPTENTSKIMKVIFENNKDKKIQLAEQYNNRNDTQQTGMAVELARLWYIANIFLKTFYY